MEKEIWKDIEGQDGDYKVSNKGRVKSMTRTIMRSNGKPYTVKGGNVKPTKDSCGYYQVCLNNRINHKLHRLIAKAFIPNPESKPQVNHINGDKEDNSLENLEWASDEENRSHAYENDLITSGPNFTENEVLDIRNAYKLGCFERKEIANAYEVSVRCIDRLINRKTYANI